MTDPKDKYEKPIPDGEVPPNEGPEPTQDELEDGGDDPAEEGTNE
jgi:hypothetical protein